MVVHPAVSLDSDGIASYSEVSTDMFPMVVALVQATDMIPATTLRMFARPFVVAMNPSGVPHVDELFTQPLPGALGETLVFAPVLFDWDHAATMKMSDLDRLLTVYSHQTTQILKCDTVSSKCVASLVARDDVVSDGEEEEEDIEDDDEVDDMLSGDEDEEITQNVDSDEDECDDDTVPFCAE